ncbi:hypothetical protein [Streptomyces sp. NPDC001601]|uniref:hypothetical protein n=1 Tax=Streptomyces sp. NPDC001601 TaxID=3364592 RepID=UPI0036843BE6
MRTEPVPDFTAKHLILRRYAEIHGDLQRCVGVGAVRKPPDTTVAADRHRGGERRGTGRGARRAGRREERGRREGGGREEGGRREGGGREAERQRGRDPSF